MTGPSSAGTMSERRLVWTRYSFAFAIACSRFMSPLLAVNVLPAVKRQTLSHPRQSSVNKAFKRGRLLRALAGFERYRHHTGCGPCHQDDFRDGLFYIKSVRRRTVVSGARTPPSSVRRLASESSRIESWFPSEPTTAADRVSRVSAAAPLRIGTPRRPRRCHCCVNGVVGAHARN